MKIASRSFLFAIMSAGFCMVVGAKQTSAPASPPTNTAKQATPARTGAQKPKPKKVWTDDDLSKLKGDVSVVGNANSSGRNTISHSEESSRGTGSAQQYRSRLAQLQSQMDATDQKITELKNIESGSTSGNSGLQLHHGYNTIPLPDQIKSLEEKKQEIQAQMDALYDEARKNGIEPGQLR